MKTDISVFLKNQFYSTLKYIQESECMEVATG